ncbi:hypothetical protein EN871_22900 [bacterium M00.F.Ca.ET.228.01.1.1]|uniref:hypothetical protein n=1 Tax=Paraburkholderia phenoliruptrix TaxID=252970 RepID=UPI001093268B|nr:hypothetical protein [Paraburkholderia phenoliruptrix]TGP41827.1 hypothetical protein EN871_22900 [bacterium M00.F.Ca.ET.228.01.1.1]TGR98618.1 hypothetical protein EN834_22515 [bacterium M00.F.Ca.ET.191.01.1.1]TGU02953.1 hypothetical protein EN798_23335 [bacterium M00.F.Ca.ET.155.01.1.1]MBW0447693.1 hypothetical protein [Paraburkholderia phenoliruptrix]MBW9098525.1 hypothetical protein [Paraburkholderia phenoliruptrix]
MTVSMNTHCAVRAGLRPGTVGLALALFMSSADAVSACPTVVTTPAGSAFDLASLVADNGSPQAALAKLRAALSKLGWGTRCSLLRDVQACNETVDVAKRAVVALEACAAASPRGTNADRRSGKERDARQSAELDR